MTPFEHIESRQNNLVKDLRRLAEHKRARLDAGLVLCEGDHLLRTMLDAGVQPTVVAMAARTIRSDSIQALLAHCPNARMVTIADAVFDQIAPADSPVGLLALAPLPMSPTLPDFGSDTLVLEAVQDPGNVGSLIRTAVAAGVRQIVLSPGCADVWSPRCLRAAQGAQWLAHVYPDADPVAFLKRYQGVVAATTLDGGLNLYEQSLLKPLAWLFGNEGQGLSRALIDHATYRVTIPMSGSMESLNVNAAAAICLFEQVRQRQNHSPQA
ncbi:MAG: RNA methyltransferase [Rhodocyclaceae bacterium]|nr:RNA methyltransferase [Rhodocyclaceae bacterium]